MAIAGCDRKPYPGDANMDFPGDSFAEQTNVPGLLLVEFGATWCGPCQRLATELDKIEQSMPVIRVDVDRNGPLATQFGVRAIPHMVLLRDGQKLDEYIGYASATEIKNWVAKHSTAL